MIALMCTDLYGNIGINNDLIYKDKKDLKRFKEITIGNIVIMGRKTFESMGSKPLKDRHNIVLSKNMSKDERRELEKEYHNLFICRTVNDILNTIIKLNKKNMSIFDVFVIGGSKIYTLLIDYIHTFDIRVVKNHKNDLNLESVVKLDLKELIQHFEKISYYRYDDFNKDHYIRLYKSTGIYNRINSGKKDYEFNFSYNLDYPISDITKDILGKYFDIK